jgi:hypothetical protein
MSATIIYTILEILKYTIPAIVVLCACYLIVQKFLTNDYQRKQLAIFKEHQSQTLPMRLQAYERLLLVVERMQTPSLINRFYVQEASAVELQLAMTQSIRTEFEYNLSQQLYVSNEVWQTINTAMEQEIMMINQIASKLPHTASAKDLASALHEHNAEQETETPCQIAKMTINKEAQMVLMNM